MLQYDFNQLIDRYHTASEKWDGVEEVFGESDLLPLWVADMDFRSPVPVIEAIKQRAEHGIFGYTLRPESYYEAIIQWTQKRHHWSIQREWICFSPGIVPALSFIVQHFSKPGDKVLIQPPVYAPFAQVVTRHGRELVTNPLQYTYGRYQMDFADLQQKLDHGVRLLILCSPHNPVGRVWTKEELTRLGEMCLERNVLVVSDEIHCDLVYKGYTHTPFGAISEDFAQNTIICTSPSKTFNLAGLHTSNIIIPNPRLRQIFKKAIEDHYLQFTNTFGVLATESAYRYGESWLDQCLEYVSKNLEFLIQYLEKHIPEIQVVKPEGTYLVWLDCRNLGMDAKTLHQLLLKQAKVALSEGSTFGQEGEGFVRINIACPRSILREGLQRIETAIKNCR
ncbi:MalY/PatB family protein [Thermoflavimicrobium dichotomicum]|uniref:cysteine-S-conjugate beta-lyase n=1 Tax=Thermoflavimicrobium dichotomicum TaxID=46223 RepID=A0A1I3TZ10_9BACL|nr:MalY/PatB family protein [Thermoflavimicrobium dichotomicum]SFJ75539.1 cystathione beta-lyase [Thermoflavimicrobium dichotomicum]